MHRYQNTVFLFVVIHSALSSIFIYANVVYTIVLQYVATRTRLAGRAPDTHATERDDVSFGLESEYFDAAEGPDGSSLRSVGAEATMAAVAVARASSTTTTTSTSTDLQVKIKRVNIYFGDSDDFDTDSVGILFNNQHKEGEEEEEESQSGAKCLHLAWDSLLLS